MSGIFRRFGEDDDRTYEEKRNDLVDNLERKGYVKTEEVSEAMRKVPRELFVPDQVKSAAYIDSPQPIGRGQTISAPHMVAIMVEELDIKKGQNILEVGGGRGYHAAVISELIGEGGKVYSVELIDELARSAQDALEKGGFDNVEVVIGDGSKGYEEAAPYDRISVACGAPEIPKPMIYQLKKDGKILIPVGGQYYQTLYRATKIKENKIEKEDLGGVLFVPLKGEYGY